MLRNNNCKLLQILYFTQVIISINAQSTLSYDAVLTIVIIELVLSFSIGVICILFSYNLFRAIKDSENDDEAEDSDLNLPGANNNISNNNIIRRRSPYGSVDDLSNFARSTSRGDGIITGGSALRSEVRGLVSGLRDGDSINGDDDDRSRSVDFHGYDDDESEMDYESKVDTNERGNGGVAAVVRSFTPYLRLW